MAYNVAGNLIAPLINKRAIQADYLSANARQLEAIYNYQRVVLNAFTEVYNRVNKVENYRKSVENKKQQVQALETSVAVALKLFMAVRIEYIDVLFSQRDRNDALMVLIETKKEQLSAIVNTYQALGGGDLLSMAARKQSASAGANALQASEAACCRLELPERLVWLRCRRGVPFIGGSIRLDSAIR